MGGFSAPQGVPPSFFLPSPRLLPASMRFLLLLLLSSLSLSLSRLRLLSFQSPTYSNGITCYHVPGLCVSRASGSKNDGRGEKKERGGGIGFEFETILHA